MNILLDTNILVFISRSKNFDDLLNFINPLDSSIYISIVTEAEIRSLAIRKRWSDKRNSLLENFLENINIVDIGRQFINSYANIDAYSQRNSLNFQDYPFATPRNMGKNDLWIASVSALMNLTLVTTDSDFDHLDGVFFEVRKIDAKDFLPFIK